MKKEEVIVGELLTETPVHVPARVNGTGMMPAIPASSMLEVIERAARDPSVDIVKLEKLLEMSERVKAREARQEFYAAFATMQTELPVIQERGEIKIGSGAPQKFARWEDINSAIKPILAKHGFALSFRTGLEENKITVTGVLSHAAGHAEETTMALPLDQSGSKNVVQAHGSSTSYGRRYVAMSLLNLASTGDEDDDGRSAGTSGTISDTEREQLTELIARSGANIQSFCTYMNVNALVEIKKKDFHRAVEALNTKITKAQKK